MERLILTKPVSVCGPNYFGRNYFVRFSPYEKKGWYWNTGNGIVPIDYKIAEKKRGRITLCSCGKELNTYEHIGVLRFLGLDSVLIESSKWPPYDGSAWIYYEALLKNLKQEGKMDWFKITGYDCEFSEGNNPTSFREIGDHDKFSFQKKDKIGLSVRVKAGWKPLEMIEQTFFIFNKKSFSLVEILPVKAQGFPFYLYNVAKIAEFFGWPHKNNITWLKNHGQKETANLFLKHRILDLLGAMSLYHNEFLPSGRITSKYGGHKEDLSILKKSCSQQIF